MPLVLAPYTPPPDLRTRLASLRRSMRRTACAHGLSTVLALVLTTFIVVGTLDYFLKMPALVRALALLSLLIGAGMLVRRLLLRPWRETRNDLTLALHVESHFPALNDALASAIAFGDRPSEEQFAGSAVLRHETRRRAERATEDCDFQQLIDTRGPTRALLALGAAATVAIALAACFPTEARIAAVRLADPFGAHPWPLKTLLDLEAPTWIARGEPFVVRGDLRGVLPERASFTFVLDGAPPTEVALAVTPGAEGSASIALRLEPNRVPRSFRYQVKANDAVTEWRPVTVMPPPQLVPIDGRPSPLVHLDFPLYTDVPSLDLPDGGSLIEGVTGTLVTIRGATDRPVLRSWVEFAPEPRRLIPAASLFALAGTGPIDAAGLTAAGRHVYGPIPVMLDTTGTRLALAFRPPITGRYALNFEDEAGLIGRRWLDIRVLPDPSPTITLERPSPGRDSLALLADATVTVLGKIEDSIFAVRSAHLEYRAGKDEPVQSLPLYEHRAVGAALPQLLGPMAPPARLRPPLVVAERRLELQQLRHADGRPLKEGDLVTLQVVADDFDDVTSPKPAGRSHEVELRVVSPSALQALVQRAEADIQKELQELHALQREARQRSQEANDQRRTLGQLRPEDMDRLVQSEQMQQQLRQRLGDEQQGLRANVGRLQQTLRDNPLPQSAERDRLDAVANEIDRLNREELPQIEPNLAAARKERDQVPPDARKTGPLPKALDHQRESERTLREMLDQLKPWSDARELGATAGLLRRELERLNRQRGELQARERDPTARPDALTPAEREELNRLRDRQAGLEERANDLVQRLDAKAREKADAADQKDAEAKAKSDQAAEREREAGQPPAKDTPKEDALNSEARDLRKQAAEAKEAAEALRREAEAIRAARDLARGNAPQSQSQAQSGSETDPMNQPPSGAQNPHRGDAQAKDSTQQKNGAQTKGSSQNKSGAQAKGSSQQKGGAQAKDSAQQQGDAQAKSSSQQTNGNQAKGSAQQKNRAQARAATQQKNGAQDKASAQQQNQGQNQAPTEPLAEQMRNATQRIGENQLGQAKDAQDAAAQTLQKVQDALAEQADRQDDADRLAKKLKNEERELDDLIDDQERLQKRTEDANKIADPAERRLALEQLAREQEQLQNRARELAQRLSRQRGEDAARELRRASRAMEQAREAMEQGEQAQDKQDEALDRLDDAQDELARARRQAEEQLQREQQAKLIDAVRGLRDRQAARITDTEELFQRVKHTGDWDRGTEQSLIDIGPAEKLLGQETEGLIEKQFKDDRVITHAVQEAADAMAEVPAAIEQVRAEPLKLANWESDREVVQAPQQLALRRLDQLLDALKMERPNRNARAQRQGGNQGGQGGEGDEGGGGGGGGDGVPSLAELKLLRALQAELLERTESFSKKHPDVPQLTETQKSALDKLRRMQADLAALFDELSSPGDPPMDPTPGEKK